MKSWDAYTATKETARQLRGRLLSAVPLELPTLKEDLLAFLSACEARLPRRESIDRDRIRRQAGVTQKEPDEGDTDD